MKRRSFILILSLFLLLGIFLTACGQKPNDSAQDNSDKSDVSSENVPPKNTAPANIPSDISPVSGQIFEVGKFTVLIPEGWFAHPMYMDNVIRDNQVNVVKGTDDPQKAFDAPLLTLTYGSPSSSIGFVEKDFYEDPEARDIEPVVIGGKTFKGYTAKAFGSDMLYLFAEDGEEQYQVAMFYNQKNGQISLEDADVRAIIESFNSKRISDATD